jgi:hypothetical protein
MKEKLKPEQVTVQSKPKDNSRGWRDMKVFKCGRTVEEIVDTLNEGEEHNPLPYEWRVPK